MARTVLLAAGCILAAAPAAAPAAASPAAAAARASAPPASSTRAATPRLDAALSEEEVRAFMTHLANASRARDVAQLAAALADDCRIELRTRLQGREQLTQLTRAQYVELLQSGYAAFRDLERYEYVQSDVRVTLAADDSAATVVSNVTETLVLDGTPAVTESEETSRIERRGGELRLVAVSALTVGR